MIWRCVIMLLTLELLTAASETNAVPATSQTNAPSRFDFDSFKIIAQRNIFNPNRSARGSGNRNGDSPRPARTESFTLVGTIMYENGQFAFFDSPSSSYKKAIKAGDTIAGYKISEVTPKGVKLELNGKTLDLGVGQQMRRADEGEWSVSGNTLTETASSSGTSDTASSSVSSADEDDVVKRLMKKREEEMNK
jgi:hypothetical protein